MECRDRMEVSTAAAASLSGSNGSLRAEEIHNHRTEGGLYHDRHAAHLQRACNENPWATVVPTFFRVRKRPTTVGYTTVATGHGQQSLILPAHNLYVARLCIFASSQLDAAGAAQHAT
eukprot:17476-Heterococcus_DN1.PRE.1